MRINDKKIEMILVDFFEFDKDSDWKKILVFDVDGIWEMIERLREIAGNDEIRGYWYFLARKKEERRESCLLQW